MHVSGTPNAINSAFITEASEGAPSSSGSVFPVERMKQSETPRWYKNADVITLPCAPKLFFVPCSYGVVIYRSPLLTIFPPNTTTTSQVKGGFIAPTVVFLRMYAC